MSEKSKGGETGESSFRRVARSHYPPPFLPPPPHISVGEGKPVGKSISPNSRVFSSIRLVAASILLSAKTAPGAKSKESIQ